MSLVLRNLKLTLGDAAILDDVSLTVEQEKFGLIGESGSGKSMLAKAILGIHPRTFSFSCSQLSFNGRSLQNLSESEWQTVRGKEIAMILQDPKASLNPLMKIGTQLEEISAPLGVDEALEMVFLPTDVKGLYPHQLSGGMGQRVMIAMMMMQKPKFLIADEIVSALDYTLRQEIIALLQHFVESERMALLFISHDLEEACRFCDRIGVMHQGQLIAVETPENLEMNPHPYVQRLFHARLEV